MLNIIIPSIMTIDQYSHYYPIKHCSIIYYPMIVQLLFHSVPIKHDFDGLYHRFKFHLCFGIKSPQLTLIYPRCSMYGIFNLQNWAFLGVNVGKYSSTMEHMGMDGLLWSRKSSLCATRRAEASQLVNQLDKVRRRAVISQEKIWKNGDILGIPGDFSWDFRVI